MKVPDFEDFLLHHYALEEWVAINRRMHWLDTFILCIAQDILKEVPEWIIMGSDRLCTEIISFGLDVAVSFTEYEIMTIDD